MISRNFKALPIVHKTLLSYSLKMALYFNIINMCLTINLYTLVTELFLLTPSAKLRKKFLNCDIKIITIYSQNIIIIIINCI